MPKRKDIKKILIIGSGPIVIGQACEFDYSGAQACKALKQQGFKVVLVNSNPATIMTDPEMADRTYIEPITPSMTPDPDSIKDDSTIQRPTVVPGPVSFSVTTGDHPQAIASKRSNARDEFPVREIQDE